MGRKKTPGLVKRGGIWHIDKQVRGSRLCESTGTSDLNEAEAYLARRIEEVRQARVYGVRPVARLAHHPSTAEPPWRASTALHLARVLNVVSATPPRSDRGAPCSHAPWRPLPTMRGEKCRLARISHQADTDSKGRAQQPTRWLRPEPGARLTACPTRFLARQNRRERL